MYRVFFYLHKELMKMKVDKKKVKRNKYLIWYFFTNTYRYKDTLMHVGGYVNEIGVKAVSNRP